MSNLTEQTTTGNREFKGGDWVVLANSVSRESTLAQILKTDGRWSIIKWLDDNTESNVRLDFLRRATDEEIAAGRRMDNRVTVITPSGTQKVKGGMVAFVEMGDDAHIENHISPLCVSKSSENESQGDLSLKENKGAFERFYKAKYMQGMSEIQIKNHHDLFRFNDYANEYWHNIVNRQWHAWNARQPEISAMQIKVDELQAENKILNQAAATHLRNQNQFMDLYNRLVEQLYPYAIDLEDPVDGDVNTPKEYMDGYNRARECVHYNLLEMMESDVEYICMQCDMLGGGGEA